MRKENVVFDCLFIRRERVHITSPLWGESTSDGLIPSQRANDVTTSQSCFLRAAPKSVIRDKNMQTEERVFNSDHFVRIFIQSNNLLTQNESI